MKHTMLWAVTGAICLLVAGGPIAACADTIKMKDGTVIEGEIKSEDDQQISIEVKRAGGSIVQTIPVKKTDIAEVVRLTPEQKTERERLLRAYANVERYRLDNDNSYPLAYYDQVINEVFYPLLARFPNSPYEKEVNDKIVRWKTDRDQVVAGKTKYRGQWMDDAVIEKLSDVEHAQRRLQEGRTRLALGLYKEAIQKFRAVPTITAQPELVTEARRMETQASNQWLQVLERQRQQLTKDIQTTEAQITHARETNATNELATAEKKLTDLRAQLDKLQEQIAGVRSLAAAAVASASAPIAATPSGTQTAPAPTVIPEMLPESEREPWFDILYKVRDWFKKGWGVVAGLLIITLVVISRKMGR